jgi:hypothetical protein
MISDTRIKKEGRRKEKYKKKERIVSHTSIYLM